VRIAALVKQVPSLDAVEPDHDATSGPGHSSLVMDEYGRRAVAQAVELAAAVGDGYCTSITVGPPRAEAVLREAIAWADAHNVVMDGILAHDPAFDGADTLATARVLAAVVEREGPFDLILVGRQSDDVGTGQVGPMLAELLDLPFATNARYVSLQANRLHVRCQHESTWVQMTIELPALVSTALGLIEPCVMPAKALATVPEHRIRTLVASDLGPGPWGADGSGIVVDARRAETRDVNGSTSSMVPAARGTVGPPIGVVLPDDDHAAVRALLGVAAVLAAQTDSHVVALATAPTSRSAELGPWGADEVLDITGSGVAEDVARAVAAWAADALPWALLAASTAFGREVAARVAASLGVGLAGDATRLSVDDGRLVTWRTAYGGSSVVAITATTELQVATVLTGSLPQFGPRDPTDIQRRVLRAEPRGRARIVSRTRRSEPAAS
jgi:electron transfer flavoprotein alpha/beta subunit